MGNESSVIRRSNGIDTRIRLYEKQEKWNMINVAITELLNWVNCKHIVTAAWFWWRRGYR